MTWFGKILAFMVLLLALCWVWLTANAFVTRTNWKKSSDDYKLALEKTTDTRAKEYEAAQAKIAELTKQLEAERTAAKSSTEQVSAWRAVASTNSRDHTLLTKGVNVSDTNVITMQASLDSAMKELDSVRKRSNTLEDDRKDLTIELAKALNDKAAAEGDARQARGRAEDADRRIESLTTQLAEAKAAGGNGASGIVDSSLSRSAPVTLEGTRGTVEAYQDGLVVISIGLDAGVGPGAELEISRFEGGGKFLGTVIVTEATPKKAVARFKPPYGKPPLARMAADDLPKAGDKVYKSTTLR